MPNATNATAKPAPPITFLVSGQRLDGVTRGAAGGPAVPPLGLSGTLTASIRIGATRAGSDAQRLEAVPGQDVVVLRIVNGPSLVLHPETARDLLMAQQGTPRGPSASAADHGNRPTTVEVPAQLQWQGLPSGTTGTRGATRGWLGDVLLAGLDIVKQPLMDKAQDFAAGTLVQRIDAQVHEAVYKLQPDRLERLKGAPNINLPSDAPGRPTLVLIHGTFSDTSGTFGKLWSQHPQHVRTLFQHYADRVYSLDHCTLGKSPIENALTLVKACPKGTRLHLVTHSRGGLVAEVLARAGALSALSKADLDCFQGSALAPQRQALQELVKRMNEEDIRVDRIVRVACPARGTLLASKRFDAYLSVFKWGLDLAQVPVFPEMIDFIGGVAQRREDPTQMPGLAAMMPDSPLVTWLHAASQPVPGQLRVVAGDLEGDTLGSWLKTLVSDAYYWTDNDLVVQTSSMYGGAPRAAAAGFVLDQGGKVNHFNYFSNDRTAEAVVNGLVQDAPAGFRPIGPMSYAGDTADGLRGAARATRAAQDTQAADTKPAVFVLPGLLGSHLKVDGQRIWLSWGLLGGLKRLAYDEAKSHPVEPDGPIGATYEKLMDHLSDSHQVLEFAFDWRKPLEEEALRLGLAVEAALAARAGSGQPVRILAHSMGGMLARVFQLKCPTVWERMMANPGARLLMLGTPNGGSWAPMQLLSGDDTFGNTLIAFGAPFQDRAARQMLAQFPGLLQLQADLLDASKGLHLQTTWQQLATQDLQLVRQYNWWHDDACQQNAYEWGVPTQPVLDRAVALRKRLDQQAQDTVPQYKNQLLQVVGQAPLTPDGYEIGAEGLVYLNVREAGDGRVTTVRAVLPGVKTWQVACAHGNLPAEQAAFDAYVDLLQTGATTRLAALDRADSNRSAAAAARAASTADAWVRNRPVRQRLATALPESADALHSLSAGDGDASRVEARNVLHITVHNGDLKFVSAPLLVGHYRSDTLTGTERVVNQLIGETMSDSLAMGQYPDGPGTHQLFLNCGSNRDNPWQMPRPESVVVVGLGDEGKLTPRDLVYTVKLGILALAQRLIEDRHGAPAQFEVAATLIGSGGIGISAGQAALLVAQGAQEADAALQQNNRRLQEQTERGRTRRAGGDADDNRLRRWPRLGRLHLIERYLDRASEAWRALRSPGAGASAEYLVDDAVVNGQGALRRPLDGSYRGTAYDLVSAISDEGSRGDERIKYAIDTKRARTELRAQSTQARLVRELVAKASNDQNRDAQIGRTLFQLLVPMEMEPFLGGSSDMLIELDRGTAGIPWEMLDTDGGTRGGDQYQPWAIRTKLLRKLRLDDFRQSVADASPDAHVLVIGEPKCTDDSYPRLPGARAEAVAVRDLLQAPDALGPDRVRALISTETADGLGPDSHEVINALMERPWRIVHIAGHGEPPKKFGPEPKNEDDPAQTDGDPRGVVLSNRTFLGPREIRNMRVVPELVFVNCCHLAARNNAQLLQTDAAREYDRASFASGVAEELIKIGVRCVIAAGWAVEDGPAKTFATSLYTALLRGKRFIDAVAIARKDAHALGGNTWAAYQCYGDPEWVLKRAGGDAQQPSSPPGQQYDGVASPAALALALETLAIEMRYQDKDSAASKEQRRESLRHLDARFGPRWGDIGAVAEAFGVAWETAGDRTKAIRWYERATHSHDGSAQIKASEQWANLTVRHAFKTFDAARSSLGTASPLTPTKAPRQLQTAAKTAQKSIQQALTRLDQLLVFGHTQERHSLRGSAYKRLAMIARATNNLQDEAKALNNMAQAYLAAETAAIASGNTAELFYPLLNRMSADAVRHAGDSKWAGWDAALVATVRQNLSDKASRDPDFWCIVGLIELALYQALLKGTLAATEAELSDQYRDLHSRVKGAGHWGSAADQLRFVLPGYVERMANDKETSAAQALLTQVSAYAA